MNFLNRCLIAWRVIQPQRSCRCRSLRKGQRIDRSIDEYGRCWVCYVGIPMRVAREHTVPLGECLVNTYVVLILDLDCKIIQTQVVPNTRQVRQGKNGEEI